MAIEWNVLTEKDLAILGQENLATLFLKTVKELTSQENITAVKFHGTGIQSLVEMKFMDAVYVAMQMLNRFGTEIEDATRFVIYRGKAYTVALSSYDEDDVFDYGENVSVPSEGELDDGAWIVEVPSPRVNMPLMNACLIEQI